MKDGCDCTYCKSNVNEYFCIKCGKNFNECSSFHNLEGMTLCPSCHPEDWQTHNEYLIDQHGHKWVKDTADK